MTASRRSMLKLAAGAGLAMAATPGLSGCSARSEVNPGQLTSTAKLPAPFTLPLPIPTPMKPSTTGAGGDRYAMTLRQADVEILPGYRTRIWGYDGTFPGPYLEARQGIATALTLTNRLTVPIATHMHGALAPPTEDGFPTDLVYPASLAHLADPAKTAAMSGMQGMPGMPSMTDPLARTSALTRTYTFPMAQRAATLWYHDHRMDFTGAQVWKGLFGLCVIRDEREAALGLPSGQREIPLMITDRAFDADGQLIYPTSDPTLLGKPGMSKAIAAGAQGDVVLVNGAPWPHLEVAAVRYRLRFVNASNARRYELELDGPADSAFTQIGSDGGLLAHPVTHRTLHISPGERFDVVVDFSRYPVGSLFTLRNTAASGGPGQVMQFKVTSKASDDSTIPDTLSTIENLTPTGARRRLVFSRGGDQWRINGTTFDPAKPLLRPKFGAVEEWRVFSTERHPFHLHGTQFQVLGRNRGGPGAYDRGWKDTVELSPGTEIRLAVRFDAYRGRFLAHCHNLEHEDMGMMATLSVS